MPEIWVGRTTLNGKGDGFKKDNPTSEAHTHFGKIFVPRVTVLYVVLDLYAKWYM